MNKLITVFLSLSLCFTAFAQNETHKVYSTFDNLSLPKSDTFDNGADGKAYIEHYGRKFHQSYDTQWGTWSGWALSNFTDNENGGFTNQYSSMTATGLSRTSNYMVGYDNTVISMDSAQEISGAYFTNSAYAYYDMKNGSNFSKKFGGDNGTDPDYLRLKLYWYLEGVFQDSSTFYLADFTASDSEEDYILDDWFYWDFNDTLDQDILTDSLVFKFESTDTSQWGINTPTYFCMDDFNALSSFGNSWYYSMLSNIENDSIYVGEDNSGGFNEAQLFFPNNYNADWNSWSGFAVSKRYDTLSSGFTNQYSPMANSNPGAVIINYGQINEIRSPYFNSNKNTVNKLQPPPPWPVLLRVTNTAYGYYDMLDGSNFSKKFGGVDGTDPDYFRLISRYIDANDSVIRRDTTYLADFRSDNSDEDYIVRDWIEIKGKGDYVQCHRLQFELQSSDTGIYGMNTPASFALELYFDIFSVQEEGIKPSLSVYPNPTSNLLNISSDAYINEVYIMDIKGTVVKSEESTRLDVSDLVPGIYFIKIVTEQGVATSKFIKQ